MVHLNLDPEIFVASPCSTYDLHIPTPAGTFIGLLGPFGHLGFFGLDNCSSTGANYFPKRKVKSDYTSSKKRKMNPSFSLEQFFLKFPILEEKICNQLNHQSLITITKASKEMMDITHRHRFYWVRNIEYQLRRVFLGKVPKRRRDLWRKVIQRSPLEIVKGISQMIAQFYRFSIKNKNGIVKCSPVHIAAEHGNLNLCQHTIDRVDDKNPKDLREETPLHWAAARDVCKLILKNVSEKNPKDVGQITPLHMAAAVKNLELCKLILLNEADKNPRSKGGNTPLWQVDGTASERRRKSAE